jgi:uncharacterized membrane protein YbhN (UPF0104 family)
VTQPRVARANPAAVTVSILAAFAVAWAVWLNDTTDDGPALLTRLPWTPIAAILVLVALVAVHYLGAAIALRAVAGQAAPLRSTVLVQFAAAATNRIVPSGVGAASVNLRFLMRSGLPLGAATSSLAVLGIVGGVTDLAYGTSVTAIGPMVGMRGATTEMRGLASHGLRAGRGHYLVLALLVTFVLAVFLVRNRRSLRASLVANGQQAWAHARQLSQQRHRVAGAAVASALTTILLSVGFVVAVETWGHSATPLPVGALIAVYLCASAAGGTVPLPPILGTTEIALVSALIISGYTSSSAIVAVIIFRAVTYWSPLPIGAWAAHRLRRSQLL